MRNLKNMIKKVREENQMLENKLGRDERSPRKGTAGE